MTEKPGILIKCPHPECEYSWRYSGRLVVYATCPSCRRNIKVAQNKVETLPCVPQVEPLVHTATAENPPAETDEIRHEQFNF
jgi:hypothetical protein